MLADRWHTCFFDLDGQQGLPGQVEDRTADDAAHWLAAVRPDHRAVHELLAARQLPLGLCHAARV